MRFARQTHQQTPYKLPHRLSPDRQFAARFTPALLGNAIPFVAIIGEQEMADGTITVKNMTTGEQKTLTADGLKEMLA